MNQLNEHQREVAKQFMATYSRADIIRAARRDGEFAMGPVLTWLRDYFQVPKTDGMPIGLAILRTYNLDNHTLGSIK